MDFMLTKEEMRTRGGLLDNILNAAFDAAILLNDQGYVIHCSEGAKQLTMLNAEKMIGRHITRFDTASPFEKVLKTGKAEVNLVCVIQGHKCLQSIYPVISNGEVIGALGMVMYSNLNSLSKLISNVKKNTRLSIADIQDVMARVQTNYTLDDFVTDNQMVKEMLYEIKTAALTSYPILLVGETGTGKEILASAIHSENLQIDFTPYVKINCSAIPYDLLESELFGYEKGAFTGANSSKKGKFEVAAGGSILLDEIGDMDLRLQGKLLRVIEEKEFERLGSIKVIPLQARIIASTNRDLRKLRLQGKFRDDLFYRLNTVEIKIPPLRDRRDDIPYLVSHFIEQGNIPIAISEEAMSAMMHYKWPGNVRELRNMINRLGITRAGKSVTISDVENLFSEDAYDENMGATSSSQSNASTTTTSLGANEKQHILEILKLQRYNIAGAARQLGSTRATLYRKIKKYGIRVKKTAR